MIQERKMREQETLKDLQKIWSKCNECAVSSIGALGGIKTLGKTKEFDLKDQVQTQFWLMVNLLNKD